MIIQESLFHDACLETKCPDCGGVVYLHWLDDGYECRCASCSYSLAVTAKEQSLSGHEQPQRLCQFCRCLWVKCDKAVRFRCPAYLWAVAEYERLHSEGRYLCSGIEKLEAKYARLVDGKIIYVTKVDVAQEEVLSATDDRLGEWNRLVREAERVRERISFVHQIRRDDDQRPSQYEVAYNTLWDEYRDSIENLRKIDSKPVEQFRDKVVTRVKELKARINNLCEDWDPDYFDYSERMLALYEKLYDQAVALGWKENRALTQTGIPELVAVTV